MSDTTQLTVRPKASQQLAALIGMDPAAMLDTIKAQCFKCDPSKVTNEMLAAFVSVASEMGVNPFLPDMLYAFPGQNGSIIPIMGPSGVYKKLMEHPDVDSWETEVFPLDVTLPATHATTKIWRKNRERPLSYTALVSEWKMSSNPNWATRCRHMIGLRSLKHAARQIIHGLPYDADDHQIMSEINVTPPVAGDQRADPVVQRKEPPARSKKGAAAVVENPPTQGKTGETPKLAGNIVEGNFTEAPAKETPATPTTQPPEGKVFTQSSTAEIKDVPPEPEPTLKDGEKITATCEIVEVRTIMAGLQGVAHPSVHVQVKGQYVGLVLHIDGAVGTDENNLTPLPIWKPGSTVILDLEGKRSTKTKKVNVRVNSVKEATPVSPAVMDVE